MISFHGPNAVRTLTGADAKAFIRSGKELNWVANSMNGTTDMKAVDEGLTKKETSVRVGMKSSFLIPSRGMNFHSRVTPAFASWWKSIYALFTKSPSPPTSLGTGPSRKRKEDNTTREAASKAPAISSDKVKNKAKPLRQSTSRSLRTSSHGSSEDKSANFSLLNIPLVELLANFDIAAELNAYNNSFGAIDEVLFAAASDPVALYATSTIIARNSEAVHDASPIPTVAPSFKAQDMISEADRYAVGFLNFLPSLSSLEERLADVESRLSDVVNLKRKEEEQIKSQQAEILKIQQRSNELKKELKLLEQKEFELSSALATSKDSLDIHDTAVTKLTASYSSMEKEILLLKRKRQSGRRLKRTFRAPAQR
ncbi:3-phosphoshikimate 1-carboxyvinyltransferase [Bienertia sinuspersici]